MSNRLLIPRKFKVIIRGVCIVLFLSGINFCAYAQNIQTESATIGDFSVVNFNGLAAAESKDPKVNRTVVHHFMHVPKPFSQPGSLTPATSNVTQTVVPLSPSPGNAFPALEDNNTTIPPDVHGAVGPNHLMVTLNSQVRIQNKSGVTLSTVSLNAFWATLGNPSVFDPKVLYDSYNNRWIFTAGANAWSSSSKLLIGVSQTSDPTGNWNLFSLTVSTAGTDWFDYPSIGFNKDWIVVNGNIFSTSGNFTSTNIYMFDKASLYAGSIGTPSVIVATNSGGTICPAITFDNTNAGIYLLQEFGGDLRLFQITGTISSPVFSFINYVTGIGAIANNPTGNFAPQLGSTNKIDAGDIRLQNVVLRNGYLWCTQTVFLPSSGPTRSAVQWWQITPSSTPVTVQCARIDDPSGTNFYAFPSIAVNANNDVLVGYSRFGASQYASANYSFRKSTDALNTMQADYQFKAGEAPYYKTFGTGENRWGDYSNTVVDPSNDLDMWTIQEYAATPVPNSPNGYNDRWGTYWAKVSSSNCVPSYNFSAAQSGTQYFEASDYIASTSIISSGSNIDYKAQNYVILSPGFFGPPNFKASIGACGSPFRLSGSNLLADDNSNYLANSLNEGILNIYPNPSQGSVTIRSESIGKISVSNLMGQEIYNSQIGSQEDLKIDLATYPKGVYFVRFSSKSEQKTQKFILD